MKYEIDITDPDQVKAIIVSSSWPGLWAQCHLLFGDDNIRLHGLRQVIRVNGEWQYRGNIRYIRDSKFNENMALTGNEPWRLYSISDLDGIAEALDRGIHIDAIRGFSQHHERWQCYRVDSYEGGRELTAEDFVDQMDEACVWERVDGWRVCVNNEGKWVPDHFSANGHKMRELYYTMLEGEFDNAEDAMAFVDQERRWY